MARNMSFSTALVAMLYVAAALASEEVQSGSLMSHWHRKLPRTPIPDALQNFIFPFSSHKTSEVVEAIKEGNKVSVGEAAPLTPKLGRKEGPDADDGDHDVTFNYMSLAADVDIITDPALRAMFFLEEELHSGTKLTLYRKLLKRSSPDSRIFFLPRALAEAIPFSSDKLSVALDMLNISQASHTARSMKQTLKVCESPVYSGEIKYCATSLESMIDYATSTLGTSDVSVLQTNVPCKLISQRYTISGIPFQSKSGLELVVCHRTTYPYAVYYCHQIQHTAAARVSLKGEDGSYGEVVTVCHRDTSWWNPGHPAFKILNVKPGGAPICHFLSGEHLLWVPAN